MKSSKLVPLEGIRGLSSIVVFIHHFFLAFAPFKTGLLAETRTNESYIGHWWFFIFNGTSAVVFFFTLSGFVLCWKYFKYNKKISFFHALIKRYFRLAIPVLVISIGSCILFKFNLYFFAEASKITKSPWLANFAFAGWTNNFIPSIKESIIEGLTTFFSGYASYNSSIWTMKPEFIGSIFIFFIVLFGISKIKPQFFLLSLCFFCTLTLFIYPFLFPFILGLYLSAYLSRNKKSIKLSSSLVLLFIGFYLLGYLIPEKNYIWIGYIKYPKIFKDNIQLILNSIGSAMVIFTVMSNNYIFVKLNNKLSYFLGKLSFPLYLTHVLVICSFGSFLFNWVYLNIQCNFFTLFLIIFLATLWISIVISLPLAYLDGIWLKTLAKLK